MKENTNCVDVDSITLPTKVEHMIFNIKVFCPQKPKSDALYSVFYSLQSNYSTFFVHKNRIVMPQTQFFSFFPKRLKKG